MLGEQNTLEIAQFPDRNKKKKKKRKKNEKRQTLYDNTVWNSILSFKSNLVMNFHKLVTFKIQFRKEEKSYLQNCSACKFTKLK